MDDIRCRLQMTARLHGGDTAKNIQLPMKNTGAPPLLGLSAFPAHLALLPPEIYVHASGATPSAAECEKALRLLVEGLPPVRVPTPGLNGPSDPAQQLGIAVGAVKSYHYYRDGVWQSGSGFAYLVITTSDGRPVRSVTTVVNPDGGSELLSFDFLLGITY